MGKRVAITGTGLISSLGDSPALLHYALCKGHTGLHPVDDGSFEHRISRLAGHISSFKPDAYLPERCFRALDRTGQLVVSAAKLALENSGWPSEKLKEHDVGLVLGTMFGSVHTISKFDRRALEQGPSCASPMDFANTVINAAAGQTAIWHKLRGINSTIACGSTSGLMALGYATDLIRYGYQTAVLAGGADEFCFESFSGFEQAGLLYRVTEGTGFPVPFEVRRTGFALSEAAALIMLEEWDAAVARGAAILGEVRGYGSTYDPRRSNGSGTDAIVRAMQAASDDAGLALSEIDCISASANGSIDHDRAEALAIKVLWNSFSSLVPVTAIKSMVGETLGASGALQAIDLIETMRSGLLPGIPELEEYEPELPPLNASREAQPIRARCGLVNSVGFDGHACALLISQPERQN
ncbi:MAG TPA: beta-ketoacyl-[acyl-carrier-protein] synthase family protein [Candidatus Angelobacter sp.]